MPSADWATGDQVEVPTFCVALCISGFHVVVAISSLSLSFSLLPVHLSDFSGHLSREIMAEFMARPTTSSGRRSVTSATTASDLGPDLEFGSNNAIISREVGTDNFLRIANYDRFQRENQALLATEQGNRTELLSLLKEGLDVTQYRGLNGFSLLHHAASRGHGLIISELLRLGIVANVRNDAQETPLHLAVYGGHILAVDQLLDYGADIDAVNAEHETALFYAVRRNYPAIVRLLVQRGANVAIEDQDGDKAADHASHPSILRHLESHQAISSAVTTSSTLQERCLTHDTLLRVFSFLQAPDLLRSSCVSTKWHRVSETDLLWKKLGVRKWEIALQSSLGFAPTATASIFKPKRPASGKSTSGSGKLKALPS